MGLKDDLLGEVKKIYREQWEVREGQVVPEPENLKLQNQAIHFKRATVLYADLSGSTALVDSKNWTYAAEVYKSYLFCAAKIIREEGGSITSYDGDRVMAIFIGDLQSNPAARSALKLNWAVRNIINPTLKEMYASTDYTVKQIVGIDTSEIHAARTGVRGGNDIVWVGRAANYAAKLTNLSDNPTWITNAVYGYLNDELKKTNGQDMWKGYTWNAMNNMQIYASTWWWSIG